MQHVRVIAPWVRGLVVGLMLAGFSLVLYFGFKIALYILKAL
jgi:hypothetical protein